MAAERGSTRRSARGARPTATDGPSTEPSEDAIRARAYELYLARGGAAGNAVDDWLEAERALRARHAPPTPSPTTARRTTRARPSSDLA